MLKKALCLILAIGLSFLSISCASRFTKLDITIPSQFDLNNQLVNEKIPLHVGIYFMPGFREFIHKSDGKRTLTNFGEGSTFHIGQAFVSGTERAMRNIFKDVTMVNEGKKALPNNIDVILSPVIEEIEDKVIMPEGSNVLSGLIKITVRWNIITSEGRMIYTNLISGENIHSQLSQVSFFVSNLEEKEKDMMLLAIKDQLSKAQDDIYGSGWWHNPWWKRKSLN